jgi:hypothetical protein
MNSKSRSALFLMEQLIVIFVFSVCAAVCISIFVESYLIAKRSVEVNHAIRVAGNGAESFKAAGGDTRLTAQLLRSVNGQTGGDLIIYYDYQWNPSPEDQAAYILRISETGSPASSLVLADVVVSRMDGDMLFSLSVAARRDNP